MWTAIQAAQSERELRAAVTGGDSWCYLVLSAPVNGEDSAFLIVVHQGDQPLYDVSARIVDVDKFDLIKGNLSWDRFAETQINLRPGNLSPNQAAMLGTWGIPEEGVHWNIFFAARNGFFEQQLRLLRIEGRWLSAIRVTRGHDEAEVTLLEKVDPKFPRDSKGQVEW